MAIVQEMCARIGMVTGRGLAGTIRTHFSKKVLYICTLLLFAANAFNIGADLGAMAKGAQLLRPSLSFPLLVVGFTITERRPADFHALCPLRQISEVAGVGIAGLRRFGPAGPS